MLNSLPNSYREVKAAIKFGRKSITMDEEIAILRSRVLEMKPDIKKGYKKINSLNVNARGRSKQKIVSQEGNQYQSQEMATRW